MPSNVINLKYKKFHKNPLRGKEYKKRSLFLRKGSLGIKVLENARLSLSQINSLGQKINRVLKNSEKYSLILNSNLTITQKTGDVRMGKGKGTVIGFIFKVRAGFILFEINTFRKSHDRLILHLKKFVKKLPIKCRIIVS
jgi:large subunit ribosomal protein L16